MIPVLPFILFLSISSIQYIESRAVISIDLGSEWMKVGIVSPGVPMEIVMNKESKRKTPAVMAYKDGVRTFGEDAVNIGIRFPKYSYKYVLDLLGKPFDHPIVKAYRERYPFYDIVKSEDRGTPVFKHDGNLTFTPEEIVAQLLNRARSDAETSAEQPISECVIIVPGFFNQDERLAIINSANMAGLKVLQLINDYTAIAINYAIFRRKEINETPSYTLFFDMGASTTKAALVEYKLVKTKEKGYVETVPQLQVVGVGYDRNLGGAEITYRLREHLIKAWEKSGGDKVRKNPRSMAKLWKEAERLKVVLSANTEHYAQIENLINDKDFKLKVSRSELEALCTDLWPRASAVINRAVSAAKGVGTGALGVIAGGGARVPAVLQHITDTLKHEPSRGINADEAATIGAVYRAAALAKGYKVAALNVRDAVVLPVQVVFTRSVNDQEKNVKRTLFGFMNTYPQKKVITFNKHTDDFTFYVNYAELDNLPAQEVERIGSFNLSRVDLTDVAKVQEKHTGDNIDPKGIKAHFSMDDSGILSLVNVEYVVEKMVTERDEESSFAKFGSTLSKFFGSDGEEKKLTEEEKPIEEPQLNTTDKTNQTESEVKPKIVTVKEPITAKEIHTSMEPMSPEHIKASKEKLDELNKKDMERAKRETVINNLESFIVDTLVKLDQEEYSKCGTSEEVNKIREALQKGSEFLDEEGYDAELSLYESKLDELKNISNALLYRHWEHKERPEQVKFLKDLLNSTGDFLKMAKNYTKEANPDIDYFTITEVQSLEKIITETNDWLKTTEAEQKKLKKYEQPKLLVSDVREKVYNLDREMKYMVGKMKLWKPKKPIDSKNKTESNKTEEVIPEKLEAEAKDEKSETVPQVEEANKTEPKKKKEKKLETDDHSEL